MSTNGLEETVQALLAPGKGILAADETVGTISKRFESLGIVSTEESRRTYRELLFSPPGLSEFISGVILYDETIRQKKQPGGSASRCDGARGHHSRNQGRYWRQAACRVP